MARSIATLPAQRDPPLEMTYDEWLAWAGDSTQSEWVDGTVIVFMPPTVLYARVLWFLYVLLTMDLEPLGYGEVLGAPVEMRIVPGRSSREPDALRRAGASRPRHRQARRRSG